MASHPGKYAWPRFGQVLALELVISLCIIVAALTVCIANTEAFVFQARLSEVFGASVVPKYELVERLATTGDLEEVRSVAHVGAGPEDFLSGQKTTQQAARPVAPGGSGLVLDKEAARARQDARTSAGESAAPMKLQYVSSSRMVGNAFVLSGAAGGRDFELAFRPAFPDDDTPFTYIWLCGRHAAPEGWLSVAAAATKVQAKPFVPSLCLKRKSS